MWNKRQLRLGSWTLADQVIVSSGAFLVNVLLARRLPAAEYGVFGLLFGAMLALQLPGAALLLQPLSVRLPRADGAEERGRLVRATLALMAGLSAALGAPLAAALAALGRAELAAPAFCCFVAWQVQEAARRGLLAGFRHRAACVGDAVSYLGQGLIVLWLADAGGLSVAAALYGMAATSVAAAAVQLAQLRLAFRAPLRLRRVAADYWSIGGAWSLGGGLLSQIRGQALPWATAVEGGLGAAAALQAATNVINMSNPLVIGLGSIIPQTAAQASGKGNAHAWRAARAYALMALPLFAGYAALILAVPQTILLVFYGAGSEYADLSPVLRLAVVGALVGYAADVAVSFLHGMVALRSATAISAVGAAATLVLSPVLVGRFGLIGACFVLLASNAARLAAACVAVARITAETARPPRPMPGGLAPAVRK